jgi:pyridoxamine 5'-phosphate oxidase
MDATDLDADPLRQLATWLDAARAAGQPMPEAMTIATATSDAVPSARMVVLRGLRRGLVFHRLRKRQGRGASGQPAGGDRAALAGSGAPPGARGGAS